MAAIPTIARNQPTPEPSSRPNYLLKSFTFPKAGASLNQEARGALGDLVNKLQAKPSIRILVLGFCDGVAEKVNASNLGMSRAQNTKSFLASRGIAKERMETATFGSTQAKAPPEEKIGQARDRRVEVWLLSE